MALTAMGATGCTGPEMAPALSTCVVWAAPPPAANAMRLRSGDAARLQGAAACEPLCGEASKRLRDTGCSARRRSHTCEAPPHLLCFRAGTTGMARSLTRVDILNFEDESHPSTAHDQMHEVTHTGSATAAPAAGGRLQGLQRYGHQPATPQLDTPQIDR